MSIPGPERSIVRCPPEPAGEKKRKKNQKERKKKGSKVLYTVGELGSQRKEFQKKGKIVGPARVGNLCPEESKFFGGSMWQTHIGRNTPPTPTAYVGEVPLIRYLPIGKESAGSPVLN
jgi:hypothetical protein